MDRLTPSDDRRFNFGKNWAAYLSRINEFNIHFAQESLCTMLRSDDLRGKSVLDIGCGSGLFSLAAMRLGADRVHSFDYDSMSVACTTSLKLRFYAQDPSWVIEQGNVLDSSYLRSLGQFDVVYAWGVLHHTGNMWRALANVTAPVNEGGKLCLAIYNDQGSISRFWKRVKLGYNRGSAMRFLVCAVFFSYWFLRGLIADIAQLKNPVARYREYRRQRGMSVLNDWIDWLGGYPYETATASQIVEFYTQRGATVEMNEPSAGLGCNQFVFRFAHPVHAMLQRDTEEPRHARK